MGVVLTVIILHINFIIMIASTRSYIPYSVLKLALNS